MKGSLKTLLMDYSLAPIVYVPDYGWYQVREDGPSEEVGVGPYDDWPLHVVWLDVTSPEATVNPSQGTIGRGVGHMYCAPDLSWAARARATDPADEDSPWIREGFLSMGEAVAWIAQTECVHRGDEEWVRQMDEDWRARAYRGLS